MGGLFGGGGKKKSNATEQAGTTGFTTAGQPWTGTTPGPTSNTSGTIPPETTTGPTTLAVDSTSAGAGPGRRTGFLVTPTLLDESYGMTGRSPTGRRETFG